MGKHFKVDLDELDGVVRQLRHLQHDMSETGQNVEYGTNVPKSAFGVNFGEADDVSHAHDRMQTYLKDVVKALRTSPTSSARRRNRAVVLTRTRITRPRPR